MRMEVEIPYDTLAEELKQQKRFPIRLAPPTTVADVSRQLRTGVSYIPKYPHVAFISREKIEAIKQFGIRFQKGEYDPEKNVAYFPR